MPQLALQILIRHEVCNGPVHIAVLPSLAIFEFRSVNELSDMVYDERIPATSRVAFNDLDVMWRATRIDIKAYRYARLGLRVIIPYL